MKSLPSVVCFWIFIVYYVFKIKWHYFLHLSRLNNKNMVYYRQRIQLIGCRVLMTSLSILSQVMKNVKITLHSENLHLAIIQKILFLIQEIFYGKIKNIRLTKTFLSIKMTTPQEKIGLAFRGEKDLVRFQTAVQCLDLNLNWTIIYESIRRKNLLFV